MRIIWKHALTILLGSQLISTAGLIFATEYEAFTESSEPEHEEKKILSHDYNELATLPTFTMLAPSGLVPSRGVAFASVSGLTEAPGTGDTDGSFAIGMGWGDPKDGGYGGSISVTVGSVTPDDDFASTGTLNLNIGQFSNDLLFGWSAGINNIDTWHDGREMPDPSLYVAGTKIIANDKIPLIINAGIGHNGYSPLRSTATKRDQEAGVFMSIGAYVLPQLSLIADSTSGVTSLGASIVPVHNLPLTVNLGFYDVFKYIPAHDSVSFMGSVSYAHSF